MTLEVLDALRTLREWINEKEIDSPLVSQKIDSMVQYYEAQLDEMAKSYEKECPGTQECLWNNEFLPGTDCNKECKEGDQ